MDGTHSNLSKDAASSGGKPEMLYDQRGSMHDFDGDLQSISIACAACTSEADIGSYTRLSGKLGILDED